MSPRKQSVATWLAVLQAHAIVLDVLEGKLQAECGLLPSSFEVLALLAGASEGRMRMQDLARSAVLSKSGVTRLVDRMEEAGQVRRASCTADRRVTYAEITPAGRKALRDAVPVHARTVDEHFARHMSEDDLRALRAILRKVIEAAGREELPCPSAGVVRAAARGH